MIHSSDKLTQACLKRKSRGRLAKGRSRARKGTAPAAQRSKEAPEPLEKRLRAEEKDVANDEEAQSALEAGKLVGKVRRSSNVRSADCLFRGGRA